MKLQASKRDEVGSRKASRLRNEGLVPGVVYGGKEENVNVSVARRDFNKVLQKEGANAILDLTFDSGDEEAVIIKDFDYNMLQGKILNVNFMRLVRGETVTVSVPISVVGTQTIKEGTIEIQLDEIEIEVLPTNIPRDIEVDVTGLAIGDSISVADLKFADGIEVITDGEHTVVVLSADTEFEEPEVDTDATQAEPEVITERAEEEK